MALNTNNLPKVGNRVKQPNLEPGVYPGRVVQVVDLGLQPVPDFKGEAKRPVNKIFVVYELSDAFMVDEDGEEIQDKPRWLNEEFPIYSLDVDNAKSTKRYHAIDPAGQAKGNFAEVLGFACGITVVNNKGKNGEVYDNVGDITPLRARDAAKLPDLVNPSLFFDLDQPDIDVFNKLPNFVQDKIKGNLNFKGSLLEELLEKAPPAEKAPKKEPKPAPVEEDNEDMDDDIPF